MSSQIKIINGHKVNVSSNSNNVQLNLTIKDKGISRNTPFDKQKEFEKIKEQRRKKEEQKIRNIKKKEKIIKKENLIKKPIDKNKTRLEELKKQEQKKRNDIKINDLKKRIESMKNQFNKNIKNETDAMKRKLAESKLNSNIQTLKDEIKAIQNL